MLAGFGRVKIVILIIVADIFATEIDLIEAVPASHGHPKVRKRAWLDRAVLVIFRKAILIQITGAVLLGIV